MKVIKSGGAEIELGATEVSPTIGLIDYSRREIDDFGVTSVVKRGFSRKMSVRLAVPFDDVDRVQAELATLRATPVRWEAAAGIAWLNFQGFYKDFNIDLATPPLSFCTLTVEGLAETETVVDVGGDPSPEGASTLLVVQPVLISDTVLNASNVTENDYPVWSASTTYALGTRVIKLATHRIYESAGAANTGNDPAGSSGLWINLGPTNRWAMFDQALGTSTARAGNVTLTLSPGAVTALALLDVIAATVRVQCTGYDRTINASSGATNFLDLPGTGGNVTVTITGAGTVSVGTLLVGKLAKLGVTGDSPSAGITDFSRKNTDAFGAVTIVERAWSKKMTAKALIKTSEIDRVANRIAGLRAQPVLWIGNDGSKSLSIYGFFKDFSIEVGETVSALALSIEGLTKAAYIAPAANILDPAEKKIFIPLEVARQYKIAKILTRGTVLASTASNPAILTILISALTLANTNWLTFRNAIVPAWDNEAAASPRDYEIWQALNAAVDAAIPALESGINEENANLNDPNQLIINKKIELITTESGRSNRKSNVRARLVSLNALTPIPAITAALADLDAKEANWLAYRNAIVPAWDNIAAHSPIVRAVFNATNLAFEAALNASDVVISQEDARRATVDGNGNLTGTNITVDNTYVAPGQNLIPGSDQTNRHILFLRYNPLAQNMAQGIYLVANGFNGWNTANYELPGNVKAAGVLQLGRSGAGGYSFADFDIDRGDGQRFRTPCVAGDVFIASAYFATHRCLAAMYLCFEDADGAFTAINLIETITPNNNLVNRIGSPNMTRLFVKAIAPAGTYSASIIVCKNNTLLGETSSYWWMAAPMLERAAVNQQGPSPYQPGPPSSVRQIGYSGDLNATYGSLVGFNTFDGNGGLLSGPDLLNSSLDLVFTDDGFENRTQARLRRGGGTVPISVAQLPSKTQNQDQLWLDVKGEKRPEDYSTRGENRIFNGDAQSLLAGWRVDPSFPNGTFSNTAPSIAIGGSSSFRLDKITVNADLRVTTRAVAVFPGQVFAIKIKYYSGAASAFGFYFRVNEKGQGADPEWVDGQTGFASVTDLMADSPQSIATASKEFIYTVPAGVFWVSLNVISFFAASSTIIFDDVSMNPATPFALLTGPEKPEDRADVTGYIAGPADITIEASTSGVPTTTLLPKNTAFKLLKNGTDYTAAATWTRTLLSGNVTSTQTSGLLSISDMASGEATVRIQAVLAGSTYITNVTVTRNNALAPPATGGGTSDNCSIWNSVSAPTPVAISDDLDFNVGANGTATITGTLYYGVYSGSTAGSPFGLIIRVQRWNGSAFVDVGPADISQSYPARRYFDNDIFEIVVEEGTISINLVLTGLTGMQKFRITGKTNIGTRQRDMFGTITATGS